MTSSWVRERLKNQLAMLLDLVRGFGCRSQLCFIGELKR